MPNYSEYSSPDLVKMLEVRFRGCRLLARLTQKEVAEKTGLSIPTIQRFEKGLSNNITLATFLLLLKTLGSIDGLDQIMPEEPESLYLYKEDRKKMQRVRHKKD